MSEKTKRRTPDFHVYMVRDGAEGSKGFWTKIGAAWSHEDGEGFNVTLEAFPTSGQLVIRKPKPKDADS